MARLGAGTRRREDGSLEKRFTIDGRRYSVYGKTAKELSRNEQEIRRKVEDRIYTDNRNLTLDKYFAEWLTDKRGNVKGNTLKGYKCYYNGHISPGLGDVKLQKLERRQILAFQRELAQKKISLRTCNNIFKILKIVLNDAVADEIISRNPAEGIKALKETRKATETYHRALTEQEQMDFMQEMETDYYYEFVAFLLCTGMRMGEAAALLWSDIDYKQNMIHVTKTVTSNEDGTTGIGSPKSEAGRRDIPLNDTIKGILASQRKKLGNVLPMHESRVFMSVYGGIVNNHAVNRAIAAVLGRLEEQGRPISHFTAHALRDTFATRLLSRAGTRRR